MSLCPSITESLVAFGLAESLVGVTRYCVHPREALVGVPRIGGTKNPDLRAILAARPDLVFANAEENRRLDVEILARAFPVDVSYPRTAAEVPGLLRHFGRQTDSRAAAGGWADRVEDSLARHETVSETFSFAYLIWKGPWMAAAGGTYISDLLSRVGGWNVFEAHARAPYPEITLEELANASPDVVLLPDEPYRFREAHATELGSRLPRSRILRVAGDDLSWHGVRTVRGLEAAAAVAAVAEAAAAAGCGMAS